MRFVRGKDIVHRQCGQIAAGTDDVHSPAARLPGGFVGTTPQHQSRTSDGRSQMGYAGVVSEVEGACAKAFGHFRQRTVETNLESVFRQRDDQSFHPRHVRLSTNKQQPDPRIAPEDPVQEFLPMRNRPVLTLTSAAGVNCNQCGIRMCWMRWNEFRIGIRRFETEGLERIEQLLRGMPPNAVCRPVTSLQKTPPGNGGQVFLKNSIRIEQEGNDEIKGVKVLRPLFWQVAVRCEKPLEATGFNGRGASRESAG